MKYALLLSLALTACSSKSDSGGASGAASSSTGGGGGTPTAASCQSKMNICREYLAKDLEKGVDALKSLCTGDQVFAEKPCDHDAAAAICTLKDGVDYYHRNYGSLKSVEKWCADTGGTYTKGAAHN